ncbi:MAG: radical SAM protein [Desulfobacteraceae bacterium]|nr:radical SAM protein [Desulfobacteraceae bacterium]MBC2757718.1 radical SAM protein [Desulfobacteraceae bacterium]
MKPSFKPFIIPIFIPHSGCPHQCIFCNQRAITGTSGAIPTANKINSIIYKFLGYKGKNRSRTEVSFFGGNFLGLAPDRIQRLLDQVASFVESKKIDGIRFSTRPDTIDEDRLNLISPYPVSTIELGVQSMDDRVLKQANRGHISEHTIHAVSLLKQKKYQIGLQMMTGLPGDSEALCLDSARQIIDLKPDFVRIYPTLVIAGSKLADLYKKGKYQPLSIEECVAQLKRLYLIFQENRINVIRMGLQASDELDDPSTVLAGPYHPALGHMVFSKIFLDSAIKKIRKKTSSNNSVTLTVHPKSLSRMQGLNKKNIDTLKQMFDIQCLSLATDASLGSSDIVVV